MLEMTDIATEHKATLKPDELSFTTYTGFIALHRNDILRVYELCGEHMKRFGAFDTYGREVVWPQPLEA